MWHVVFDNFSVSTFVLIIHAEFTSYFILQKLGVKISKDDRAKTKVMMDIMKQQAGIKPDDSEKSS